jgi:hypothetical protein
VVAENIHSGALDRLGYGYEQLSSDQSGDCVPLQQRLREFWSLRGPARARPLDTGYVGHGGVHRTRWGSAHSSGIQRGGRGHGDGERYERARSAVPQTTHRAGTKDRSEPALHRVGHAVPGGCCMPEPRPEVREEQSRYWEPLALRAGRGLPNEGRLHDHRHVGSAHSRADFPAGAGKVLGSDGCVP